MSSSSGGPIPGSSLQYLTTSCCASAGSPMLLPHRPRATRARRGSSVMSTDRRGRCPRSPARWLPTAAAVRRATRHSRRRSLRWCGHAHGRPWRAWSLRRQRQSVQLWRARARLRLARAAGAGLNWPGTTSCLMRQARRGSSRSTHGQTWRPRPRARPRSCQSCADGSNAPPPRQRRASASLPLQTSPRRLPPVTPVRRPHRRRPRFLAPVTRPSSRSSSCGALGTHGAADA